MPSDTPSASLSTGQPFSSTLAPFGVFGQVSTPSQTLSPSASSGQPFASTTQPAGVLGHWSFLSSTPSTSASAFSAEPPSENIRPPVYAIEFCVLSVAPASCCSSVNL